MHMAYPSLATQLDALIILQSPFEPWMELQGTLFWAHVLGINPVWRERADEPTCILISIIHIFHNMTVHREMKNTICYTFTCCRNWTSLMQLHSFPLLHNYLHNKDQFNSVPLGFWDWGHNKNRKDLFFAHLLTLFVTTRCDVQFWFLIPWSWSVKVCLNS